MGAKSEMDYEWTEADYKRASAPSSVEFMRFNALRSFDRLAGVHKKSRRAYALLISNRIKGVDIPDGATLRKIMMMEESTNKKKKESLDLNGEVMREELQRRIKYAIWLAKVRNERIKGKKKVDEDDDDDDGQAMGREFQRRINWVSQISEKHGIAASDAAAKSLIQAVNEAVMEHALKEEAALYSS